MKRLRQLFICTAMISTFLTMTGCTFGKTTSTPAPFGNSPANLEQNQPGVSGNQTADTNQTGSAAADASKPLDAGKNYAGTSIDFINSTEGWIGGKGFILHSKDGGQQWRIQYEGPYEFTSVTFLDSNHG